MPRASHPWPRTIPSSRFGQTPGESVTYTKVKPRVVVELDVDTAFEDYRWHHAANSCHAPRSESRRPARPDRTSLTGPAAPAAPPAGLRPSQSGQVVAASCCPRPPARAGPAPEPPSPARNRSDKRADEVPPPPNVALEPVRGPRRARRCGPTSAIAPRRRLHWRRRRVAG